MRYVQCMPSRIPFAVNRCPSMPVKGTLAELNSRDPIFYIKHNLDGTQLAVFHVNIIDILDNVFTHNALKFLSKKQERFINRFIKEAGLIDSQYEQGSDDIYQGIDDVFKKLDHFLGNYVGVDENEYTR